MGANKLVALAFAIGLTAAQDLASALSSQDSLSSLVDLLGQYPETTKFLASQDGVTLFAPSNDALASLTQDGGLEGVDVDQVLRYHLYQGVLSAADIRDVPLFLPSYFASNNLVSNGQVASVSLNQDGDAVVTSGFKSVSKVVTADVEFDNGIVQIVDKVLQVPSGVADTLVAGGLTALAGAATQLDLVETLEGLGDITLFAPNNDAFAAIAAAAGGLSTAQLTETLQYHVIFGTVVYSTLLDNVSVPTLQGTTVDITVDSNGAVFVDGARVINSDILIGNGVLHVIDSVLNPDEEDPTPGVAGFPTADPDIVPFTSGVPTGSVQPQLSATTSEVAALLVTAAPEPTIYLLQDGSLSTAVPGSASAPGSSGPSGATSSASTSATVSMTSRLTSSTMPSGAMSSDAVSSGAMSSGVAPSSAASDSASASPAQQTDNAGMRKEWSVLAAVVAAVCAAGM